MKVNPLVNEIAKGYWAMSFDGLHTWAPIAHRIMSGESLDFKPEPKAIMTVFDESGRRVEANEDGLFDAPKGSIAVVDLVGPLIKYGDWCSFGALEIVERLQAADRNPNIIGTIANFDGPGGGVSSIAPFVEFGRTKTKPVVGLFDQCCSAHLWAMYAFCDHVMAENNISAMIGSIGVVMSFVENREALKKLGYNFHEIYPEESKDKNKAFSLALEGKYDLIKQEMLSPMAISFQNAVKAARPQLKLAEPGIITGKVFFAEHAIDIGLADSKGSMAEAMNRVRMLGEMNHYK